MHVVLLGTKKIVMETLLSGGHEVTLLYEPWEEFRVAPYRDAAKHWCLVDSHLNVESLWSALHHVGALATPIDAVVSTGELGVVPAAVLGRMLGARALDPEVALRCRDKAIQKATWRAAGVPTAKWVVVPDARARPESVLERVVAAGMHAPFVVKPISGYGTRNVVIANDAKELAFAVAQLVASDPALGRLMIEEFQKGGEWHFDGIVRDGKLLAFHVSQYIAPMRETKNGQQTASLSYPPRDHLGLYEEARRFATNAFESLGLVTSVFHMEAFAEEGTHAFVAGELAARPGGNYICQLAKRVVGADIWAAATQLYTDDDLTWSAVSDQVCAFTDLPCSAGLPNRLRPEDVLAMEGVVDAMVTVPYGASMPDMRVSSATNIGCALIEAPSQEACRARIADLARAVRAINEGGAVAGAPS